MHNWNSFSLCIISIPKGLAPSTSRTRQLVTGHPRPEPEFHRGPGAAQSSSPGDRFLRRWIGTAPSLSASDRLVCGVPWPLPPYYYNRSVKQERIFSSKAVFPAASAFLWKSLEVPEAPFIPEQSILCLEYHAPEAAPAASVGGFWNCRKFFYFFWK